MTRCSPPPGCYPMSRVKAARCRGCSPISPGRSRPPKCASIARTRRSSPWWKRPPHTSKRNIRCSRSMAVETAGRAWERTFAGGASLIDARNLALTLQAFMLVFAITWATGNLLIVYRAIGSVQMPRRLGDLEIVEAVSHRVLFGGTLLLGLILGILFSLGTGDWWRHAALASAPPHFGVADDRLRLDAGYFLGVLPWLSVLQNRALVLALGALAIVVLLYGVIGSLRLRRGRIRASNYARAHGGVLLAVLAFVISWGAVLDPAEVVAGMHGPSDQAALTIRIPGAHVVTAIAILTGLISL